ncbi:MAG TPA: hypothetical protein VF653_13275 [Methylomirabilota bacterium]
MAMASSRRRALLVLTAKLFRGLGDLSRLRVLTALGDGSLSAAEIVAQTGLTSPRRCT